MLSSLGVILWKLIKLETVQFNRIVRDLSIEKGRMEHFRAAFLSSSVAFENIWLEWPKRSGFSPTWKMQLFCEFKKKVVQIGEIMCYTCNSFWSLTTCKTSSYIFLKSDEIQQFHRRTCNLHNSLGVPQSRGTRLERLGTILVDCSCKLLWCNSL